ncbi:hypothetical protein [Gordonia amicalis]|uniref:hypothetical protein n=1 Tax=Gordonia amicalis TaxID=89053 RepID=UPI003A80BE91
MPSVLVVSAETAPEFTLDNLVQVSEMRFGEAEPFDAPVFKHVDILQIADSLELETI